MCQPEHIVGATGLACIGRQMMRHRARLEEMLLVGQDTRSHHMVTLHLCEERTRHPAAILIILLGLRNHLGQESIRMHSANTEITGIERIQLGVIVEEIRQPAPYAVARKMIKVKPHLRHSAELVAQHSPACIIVYS